MVTYSARIYICKWSRVNILQEKQQPGPKPHFSPIRKYFGKKYMCVLGWSTNACTMQSLRAFWQNLRLALSKTLDLPQQLLQNLMFPRDRNTCACPILLTFQKLPNGKFPLLPDTFYISDTQPLSPVRSKITCWLLFNGQWLHLHVWLFYWCLVWAVSVKVVL